MERMVRYKQDGREMRFEYDALNKVWGILAGFERPGYIAAGAKQSDIDKIVETLGDEGATLPTRCKGVPLRFANVFEMFDAHDMELLCKHQVGKRVNKFCIVLIFSALRICVVVLYC